MKKTLAIVLALAMVLCMIPASFADTTTNKTITDKSYTLQAFKAEDDGSAPALGDAKTSANSLTVEYKYEDLDEVETGKFTADKKIVLINVKGFDNDFADAKNIKVTIDGKELAVNSDAVYQQHVGFVKEQLYVVFPVEATKAGYSDTYLIEVTGEMGDVKITETAKISLKMVNTNEYKNAKTATISKIESNDAKLDAYIVGSKIYLDFAAEIKQIEDALDITFKDNNGNLFDVVTWAYQTDYKNKGENTNGAYIYLEDADGEKLDSSKMTYSVGFDGNYQAGADKAKEVVFKLETASNIYETKEYEIVARANIVEADPKGIYFAETTKTIKIGEEYTPVVMGVATNKKVDATIDYGTDGAGAKVNAEYIDVEDGETVIGTKEGVAYITASYTTNNDITYTASSMKIVVTTGTVEETTDGAKYIVTASSLNVRSGAGTNYAKVGSLANGAIVTVDTIANGWAKLSNGNYVSAQYLAKVVENGEAQTMYVTCRTLNVRKGPGTSYAKAGTLSRGTAVQVVGMTGSWAKLSNGYYVSANYLSK